ncbi:MAG: hypothetical protein ACJASM_000896 [Salibacteraceae bacterium]|jgi:hypothetical protein
MSKFNWEEFKKDKKKFWTIAGVLFLGLVTIILGVSGGGEPEVEKKEQIKVASVDVPTDAKMIENGIEAGDNRSNADVDFFGNVINKEKDDTLSAEVVEKKELYVFEGYGKTNPSAVVDRTPSSSGPVKVEPEKSIKESERRRRVPSDESGTMTGASKSTFDAVIANGNKMIKSGSRVKLRLTETISVSGMEIPRNTIISGIATYQNERMLIDVSLLVVDKKTVSVKWEVVGVDGLLGLEVPESLLHDIVEDGTGEVIEGGGNVEANIPVLGSVKINLDKKNKSPEFIAKSGDRIYITEKKQ